MTTTITTLSSLPSTSFLHVSLSLNFEEKNRAKDEIRSFQLALLKVFQKFKCPTLLQSKHTHTGFFKIITDHLVAFSICFHTLTAYHYFSCSSTSSLPAVVVDTFLFLADSMCVITSSISMYGVSVLTLPLKQICTLMFLSKSKSAGYFGAK